MVVARTGKIIAEVGLGGKRKRRVSSSRPPRGGGEDTRCGARRGKAARAPHPIQRSRQVHFVENAPVDAFSGISGFFGINPENAQETEAMLQGGDGSELPVVPEKYDPAAHLSVFLLADLLLDLLQVLPGKKGSIALLLLVSGVFLHDRGIRIEVAPVFGFRGGKPEPPVRPGNLEPAATGTRLHAEHPAPVTNGLAGRIDGISDFVLPVDLGHVLVFLLLFFRGMIGGRRTV